MTEPDVTLTDYGLAIECALFTYLVFRSRKKPQLLRIWFALFFGSLSLAALLGGTVHGFFLDTQATAHTFLWQATLLAIGVTALSLWAIGANIQFSVVIAHWITITAAVEFIAYCIIVLLVTQNYYVVIFNYLPAVVFLLIVFGLVYVRTRETRVLVGFLGFGLTLVAAWVQQERIALHPVYFNHNANYHLIQAIALLLIFGSSRGLILAQTTR